MTTRIAGYAPIHFQQYIPDGVLPKSRASLAEMGVTTHLQAVYKRDQ